MEKYSIMRILIICDIKSGDPWAGMLHTYYSTRFRACTYKPKLRTFDTPFLCLCNGNQHRIHEIVQEF